MKLYVVRVIREAYVLAEDEAEARGMSREIGRWEEARVAVSDGREILDSWEDDADHNLVYHNGDCNITLAKARRMVGM